MSRFDTARYDIYEDAVLMQKELPLITLTTDFGTQDGYVGSIKGRLLNANPLANIIDITHNISPQNILQAAFCIKRIAQHFPPNTIHLVVVDPGVGSHRNAVLIRTSHGVFLAPDNGVLTLALLETEIYDIRQIYKSTDYWTAHNSFDGLELFAPVAAYLLTKNYALDRVGKIVPQYQQLTINTPTCDKQRIIGEILLFDRFGNAITNISKELIEQTQNFRVRTGTDFHQVFLFSSCYSQNSSVKRDSSGNLGLNSENDINSSQIAIINSDNLLELAVFCNSAQRVHELTIGQKVMVEYTHKPA